MSDGAIYMVAYGVLEYKPPILTIGLTTAEVRAILTEESKAHEIYALVKEAFEGRDWLLTKRTPRWKTKEFVLLGPLKTTPALDMREKIAEGNLQEVCLAAVNYDEYWSRP